MLRTFDLTNCFYFATVTSTFDTAYLCFFWHEFISSSNFVLDKTLVLFLFLELRSDTLTYITKQTVQLQCITDRYIQTYYEIYPHFDFESVLSSNTHSWRANIYYSWGVAEALSVFATYSFCFISAVFSLLRDKHFETNENISNRSDESNTP